MRHDIYDFADFRCRQRVSLRAPLPLLRAVYDMLFFDIPSFSLPLYFAATLRHTLLTPIRRAMPTLQRAFAALRCCCCRFTFSLPCRCLRLLPPAADLPPTLLPMPLLIRRLRQRRCCRHRDMRAIISIIYALCYAVREVAARRQQRAAARQRTALLY